MLRGTVLSAVAAMAAALLCVSTAGAAVRPFAAPQAVVADCEALFFDSVVTTGGALRGFASCPSSGTIEFFSRSSNGTVNPSETSGFSGSVMAVTYDLTATYVLFHVDREIRVGKRTNAGAYSSRTVDTFTLPFPSGDIIAKDGLWFAVWSKWPPDGRYARLYSGGSFIPVSRVSNPPYGTSDGHPTMAYSGSIPVLIWHRSTTAGRSDLRLAKYVSGSWQGARVFASAGSYNDEPDIKVAAGVTFVAWTRAVGPVLASNATGTFETHQFTTASAGPKIAVSVTGGTVDHVFLAANRPVPYSNRTFFAETASTGSVTGTWGTALLAPHTTWYVTLGASAGKATVVYSGPNSVFARSQA